MSAQTLPATEMDRAQQELTKIRDLVQAGALPRARLEEAEFKIEDARDDAVLRQTLFGNVTVDHLTPQQAQEMIAAAQRRVDRQKAKVERSQKLIDTGVIARAEIAPLTDELALREQTMSLAQSRAKLLEELARMAEAERAFEAEVASQPMTTSSSGSLMVRFHGTASFDDKVLGKIETAYEKTFRHVLPISANGETSTHRALGFDHRGRVDVAVNPDQREGLWLRSYLESAKIPYYAFRGAIAGKATGPHIHIGPPSQRLQTVAD